MGASAKDPPLKLTSMLIGISLIKILVFYKIFFNLPSFTPPVRATVGEVRYSIEIDVGGGSKGSILQNQILRKILAENGPHV